MKLSDISESILQYGDNVKVKDINSKYADLRGKIININSSSASVKFDEIKKPMTIMLTALEKT